MSKKLLVKLTINVFIIFSLLVVFSIKISKGEINSEQVEAFNVFFLL